MIEVAVRDKHSSLLYYYLKKFCSKGHWGASYLLDPLIGLLFVLLWLTFLEKSHIFNNESIVVGFLYKYNKEANLAIYKGLKWLNKKSGKIQSTDNQCDQKIEKIAKIFEM